MGWLLKWLSGAVGPYILGLAGVALAASMGYASIQHYRAARYQAQAQQALQAMQGLQTALRNKEASLTMLLEELQSWEQIATTSREQQARAVQTLRDHDQKLEHARAEGRVLAEKDRDLPNCEHLLAIDLAATCPGHARGVFQRAADRLPGPHP